MRPRSGNQRFNAVRRLPECGSRECRKGMFVWLAAFRDPPRWQKVVFVLLLAVLSLAAAASGAAVAQVTVTASPPVITAGETGAITVMVSRMDIRSPGMQYPLPGAMVSLSTSAPGISFSPDGGTTDTRGTFTALLLASSGSSGNVPVQAVARLSNDFYGEGSAIVTIEPQLPAETTPTGTPATAANLPPVAVISIDRYAGPAPLTVRFDGQGSSDPDGAVESFLWDFGDGTTATEAVADHRYDTPGTFLASLVVTDAGGLFSDPVTVRITVQPGQTPEPGPAGSCDDNNRCTVGDTYDASGTCVPGPAISCDDGNPETADTCDPAAGCMHAQRNREIPQQVSIQPTAPPAAGRSPETTVRIADTDLLTGIMNAIARFFQGIFVPAATVQGDGDMPLKSDRQPVPCTDAGGTICPGTGCRKLMTDPGNCGACGKACPSLPHAAPACSSGACSFTCIQNYGDCNNYAPDGCETGLAAGMNNCGACGNACPADRVCQNSTCMCTGKRSDCSGTCTDLAWDSQNCKACGNACRSDQVCQFAVCRCPGGTKECGGKCIDFYDPHLNCYGRCINTLTDMTNCGNCGIVCKLGTYCSNGICVKGG